MLVALLGVSFGFRKVGFGVPWFLVYSCFAFVGLFDLVGCAFAVALCLLLLVDVFLWLGVLNMLCLCIFVSVVADSFF